ncbi:hypothetical protein Hanom_Chr09g00801891 [Helianthus anomalus]
MHPNNRWIIPPRSSAYSNQTTSPSQLVSPVPTRPTPYESGIVGYNQNQSGFMNLLNQSLSWDPNLYCWNPNYNMGGIGSSQAFGSPLRELGFIPGTQTEPQTVIEEAKQNKGFGINFLNFFSKQRK